MSEVFDREEIYTQTNTLSLETRFDRFFGMDKQQRSLHKKVGKRSSGRDDAGVWIQSASQPPKSPATTLTLRLLAHGKELKRLKWKNPLSIIVRLNRVNAHAPRVHCAMMKT